VTGFEEDADGVTLKFSNGNTAHGDMLIGADGVKSAIRRQIAGDAPATYTGDCAWRITLPVEELPNDFLPQVMSVFMGPGGTCRLLLPARGQAAELCRTGRNRRCFRRKLDRQVSMGKAEGRFHRLER
jgi:2-polyprenyl-6-methoxyphenol hydroxylase-like FAD-dependent oxidoreductase